VLSEPIKFKPLIGVGAKYLKKLSKRALRDLISNPDSEDNKAWIAQNQYIPKTTRKKPKGV
jgi:hypothetical protein